MKPITLITAILLFLTMFCSVILAQEKVTSVELKKLDELPPIYVKISEAEITALGEIKKPAQYEMVIKEQPAINLLEESIKKESKEKKEGSGNTDPATRAWYVVGGIDLTTYYYIEIDLPSCLTDVDGGTIRLIMQHETDGTDQVRMIDEHIGTEYNSDLYGRRGRYKGRYGWTRQSGGGDFSWILGDGAAHTLANPWGWAWIVDYRWGAGGSVLPGDRIRIYSHPHVPTRVIIKD